jgi:hypothetical protein
LEEYLLELWFGVCAYDGLSGKMFNLRAAVLWCIHDYLALRTLLGHTTKEYFTCIHCDKHPLSYSLRSKIGYFGYYHFLPNGYRLRRDNEFIGIRESSDPLGEFSIEELLAKLNKLKDVRSGKPQSSGKRKCSDLEGAKVKMWSWMFSL